VQRRLVASLSFNAVLLAALAAAVRLAGVDRLVLRLGLRHYPPAHFEAIARERFRPAAPGSIVFAGDSLVQLAPLEDMFGRSVRNRGIGGAYLSDVAIWLPAVLADRPGRLLLLAGANDVAFRAPLAESAAAARRLCELIDCPATIVSVPPIRGKQAAAAALNRELKALAAEFGFDWVDVVPALSAMVWTDDGVHLTNQAYHRIAPLLLASIGPVSS